MVGHLEHTDIWKSCNWRWGQSVSWYSPKTILFETIQNPYCTPKQWKTLGIIIMSYPKLWIVSPASCSLVSFPFLGCNNPRVVHEIPHFSWLNPQTNVQKWYKFWKATSPSGGKIHGFERFHPVPPQKPQHLEDEWESHYGSLHFIQVLVHQTELLPMISGQIPCMPSLMLQILQVPRICVSMDQIWVFMPTSAIGYPTAKKWPTFSWQWMSTCCWGTQLWSTGYVPWWIRVNAFISIYCENLSWGNQVTH